jgi:hypothetical protein
VLLRRACGDIGISSAPASSSSLQIRKSGFELDLFGLTGSAGSGLAEAADDVARLPPEGEEGAAVEARDGPAELTMAVSHMLTMAKALSQISGCRSSTMLCTSQWIFNAKRID